MPPGVFFSCLINVCLVEAKFQGDLLTCFARSKSRTLFDLIKDLYLDNFLSFCTKCKLAGLLEHEPGGGCLNKKWSDLICFVFACFRIIHHREKKAPLKFCGWHGCRSAEEVQLLHNTDDPRRGVKQRLTIGVNILRFPVEDAIRVTPEAC